MRLATDEDAKETVEIIVQSSALPACELAQASAIHLKDRCVDRVPSKAQMGLPTLSIKSHYAQGHVIMPAHQVFRPVQMQSRECERGLLHTHPVTPHSLFYIVPSSEHRISMMY